MSAVIQSEIDFRPMVAEDLLYVMDIERAAYDYPWTVGIFSDCIRVGYICRVLEVQGELTAYGVMSVAAGEAHILNLCVRPDSQGQGYGRCLLDDLVDIARRLGAEMVLLEVRPSNRAALALYHKAGFNEVGTRKSYYPHDSGREDAIILAMNLT